MVSGARAEIVHSASSACTCADAGEESYLLSRICTHTRLKQLARARAHTHTHTHTHTQSYLLVYQQQPHSEADAGMV